uniref:Uncharacterized protein n=1 Tax=candidate division WOR-3 bacterium TaxID=2052148 RepID=A0A7C6E9F8_UNCW3
MPYTIDNPPDRIKTLPKHAQEIWINAYNAALIQYEDEGKANAVAWAAVEKAGYYKDKSGKWVKSEMTFDIESGELCAEEIKIPLSVDITKLTEGDANPFFVVAKALKVGISKNKRIYSRENLEQLKSQLPLYGYLGHIKEEDIGSIYRKPVTVWLGGEIINDWLYVKGYVFPDEKDLRKSIEIGLKIGKPPAVSVLNWLNLQPCGENQKVLDLKGVSIDWASYGFEGVPGAQVVSMGSEQTQKEVNMERAEFIAGLTLDDLKKERPDLIQALSAEMQTSDEEKKKQKETEDKIKTLEAENLKLKTEILNAHKEKLLGEIKDEKIREIAKDLLQGESIEKLEENWKLVKEKLGKLEKPGMPILNTQSNTKKGSDFLQDRYLTT